jgi:hypothetical protein
MDLLLKRETFTEKSTISSLFINGVFECYILEDKDRGLSFQMSLEEINKLKVYGETAIPYGSYQIVLTMSNRFKRILPLLVGVKGYEGIRIHTGNTAADTHGCLLPAWSKSKDTVSKSTLAFNQLFTKLQNAKDKIYITITK